MRIEPTESGLSGRPVELPVAWPHEPPASPLRRLLRAVLAVLRVAWVDAVALVGATLALVPLVPGRPLGRRRDAPATVTPLRPGAGRAATQR